MHRNTEISLQNAQIFFHSSCLTLHITNSLIGDLQVLTIGPRRFPACRSLIIHIVMAVNSLDFLICRSILLAEPAFDLL